MTHKALNQATTKHRLTEDALDDIDAFTDLIEKVNKWDDKTDKEMAEKYIYNERRDSLHYYARVKTPADVSINKDKDRTNKRKQAKDH